MADELEQLKRKVFVARKELNNLRKEMIAMKKMFIHKFKELQEKSQNDQDPCDTAEKHQEKCSSQMVKRRTNMSGPGKLPPVSNTWDLKPIGFVESCFKEKNGIPRQPSVCPGSKAKLRISVHGFTNPVHSLEGLEKFSHVWIIFVFHENTNKTIKAKVKPPRLNGAKVGVFASRSPHRPNPVGLTLARLDDIIGNTLLFSGVDILDGTPVLDIKPFVPDYDVPIAVQTANNSTKENEQCSLQDKDSVDSQVNRPCISRPPPDKPDDEVHIELSPEVFTKRKAADMSVAEWIRKPPIKELNVEFTVDAEAQIRSFHGKVKLRGRCPFEKANANAGVSKSSSAVKKCSCLSVVINEHVKCISSSDHDQSKSKQEYDDFASAFETIQTVRPIDGCQSSVTNWDSDQRNKKSLQPSSDHTASLESTSTETPNRKGYDSKKELSRERLGRSHAVGSLGGWKAIDSVQNENIFQSLEANAVRCLESARSERSLFSQACIYELEMLSSPEEARKAIVDILRADPRSTYRRTRCPGQLYHFSIDKINVTCQFDETTAWVLGVEPVFHRANGAGELHLSVDSFTTELKP